jgi:hypothetical protein
VSKDIQEVLAEKLPSPKEALKLLHEAIMSAGDDALTDDFMAELEQLTKFVYVSRCHIAYLASAAVKGKERGRMRTVKE